MGARPAKTFAPPGAYALSTPINAVSQAQPEAIVPPQQLTDPNSYVPLNAVATPTSKANNGWGNGRGRHGKYFGDIGPDYQQLKNRQGQF